MNINKKILTAGYDIVVFDCDSTLTAIEGIDLLAKKRGQENEVKTLTEKAMNGQMKFEDVFSRRLNLIKPKKADLDWLAKQYIKHQIKDAREIIRLLKKAGKKVYIVTGGYEIAVKKFATYLGILKKNVFAVKLKFNKNGHYLGYDTKNRLTKSRGKKEILQKIGKLGSVIFVGDGATDIKAKNNVDLFVGFGGVAYRPIVQKNADIFINLKTLAPIFLLAQGTKLKYRDYSFARKSKNVFKASKTSKPR